MPNENLEMSSQLDPETRKSLLRVLWRSRLGDLREQSLIRQGKGWFHISGMGHEALAGIALHLEADDYAFPYYRDRAFCTQRGMSDYDLALAFYAKRDSSSGGRQLTGHFSDRKLNIWSHPSPVGVHLLPACGAAWGIQLDGKPNVVYASLGEASARQGDFYEAVCFAKERKLPMVFVVQDNRIAISTSTTQTNPIALGVLDRSEWIRVDGSDVEAVAEAGRVAVEQARSGQGPAFIWCDVERFSNHSSADDQRMYRAADELEAMHERDPISLFQSQLIADGILTEAEATAQEEKLREAIRAEYRRANGQTDPLGEECALHLTGSANPAPAADIQLDAPCRMLDAVNRTFHAAMDALPDVVFFGEDIADPKGGVFNLTKGLSTKDPERAVNSPLAESTIMGVAVGLASYGKRPCFEIQFVDFIYPGWNQLVSNMATLRWRSFGQWKCPLVIYAPCGGYLPGGALWHSQAGEASFARVPGIRVVVPSTPGDAAGLFWTALHGEDPTIILLPKHLMWAELPAPKSVEAIPLGQARLVRSGELLTLVTWGNCVELVEETLEAMNSNLDVELIDLRSIAPWDKKAVAASVRKTGRLLIVQEDNISASVGQMIVAEMCSDHTVLQCLKTPPVIVSKDDVHVGFNPIYEYAALPDQARITAALDRLLSTTLESSLQSKAGAMESIQTPIEDSMTAESNNAPSATKMITVPILGEGIRVARVVSILKEAGEAVKADDPLCEVETDKAVFPIECDEDGILGEWLIAEEDEVSVGQELVPLQMSGAAAVAVKAAPVVAAGGAVLKKTAGLSLEAVKSLQGIIPATIEMTCRWEAVRDARLRSKETSGGTLSTATMAAWAVVQAMHKHERFASIIRGEELIYDPDRFDLGMAVALPGDALETAVVKSANTMEWDVFTDVFNNSLRRTRHGEVDSKNRVSLSISSMGAYNVRSAIPIVVPPSVATIFIGAPYTLPDPKSKDGSMMEVASLVLTFDHRWINGVGAAAFLSEVRKGIERFDLV
ncbi:MULTISPECIES: thiamine pyrophosphate-dependent enzyme [unclassified Lentimonas]|uniref:thiamine pyrophosphate-dependent enzyme n=2 Tax=Lentimonas TaxID=417293 RepID=UPI001321E6FC|nr:MULTISPECIES: thiamine pyrophosphate-dependent enzyme [unclassified Lentimonas]CAA7182234.1 Branched-chain alpha-keto acid dehydrogenase, E1 component, alpha subunit (EC / Branched-chain alpha-keto acid dehydrogenase, E1 component, beta subunit (EC [Lentimonas sp. CC8]CAA6676616.1 Branched-chain alpha-keto acid dehydrogenase, E1 component, alpha subunit (EC / Branched-chain alpha-keto acid dehydrogenase, E1 component, beta subunit (EC [Lentimonas sp. CC4]CAA6684721.1 Branched-chain alpha-keto